MSDETNEDKKCCCGGNGHHEDGHECCGGHGHGEGHECCGRHKESAKPEKVGEKEINLPKDVPLPNPTIITLASSIATQAMISMGIFPHPVTGKSEFFLHQAKHLIDTVDMLIQKTQGNTTEEESKTLANILSELQMLFVAANNEKNRRES